MLKISIPTPCHEDWNKMDPNQQGRHCNSCMKTVVDFTNMSDEEVKNFLLNKKEDQTCGRFKSSQLQRIEIELPQNIYYIQMPLWKRFLVACLVVFSTTLFSCEVKHTDPTATTGVLMSKLDLKQLPDPQYDSSINYNHPIVVGGFMIRSEDTSISLEPAMDTTVPVPMIPDTLEERIFIGDTIYTEIDTVRKVPAAKIGKVSCTIKDSIPKIPEPQMIKGEMKFIPEEPKDSVQCEKFS